MMHYYEVWVASGSYQSNDALTYMTDTELPVGSVVSVPLRKQIVSGFIAARVKKPNFPVKPIHTVVSAVPLPEHCLPLARWVADYWCVAIGEVLRQFGPTQTIRRTGQPITAGLSLQSSFMGFSSEALTGSQRTALQLIRDAQHSTVLLHGITGAGKTRVYLELARERLTHGKSILLLTPEISLTTQLAQTTERFLGQKPIVFHSELTAAERKKLWRQLLESDTPEVIVGPRSALFLPIHNIGLIIVDEAHESAYKQEQVPRYNALRVASKLAELTGSKAVLGSATPLVSDYYVASEKQAVVRMSESAKTVSDTTKTIIVDSRKRELFSYHPYLSEDLIRSIKEVLEQKRQSLLFLNRRGTARLIACEQCGWQLLCPHCDIPVTYHGDTHTGICHSCGYHTKPPTSCPSCGSLNVLFKGIGTKALEAAVRKLLPHARVERYDSDSSADQRLEKRYDAIRNGEVDIIIGTQLIAKGLDLPNLELVGIVIADSGLWMPDYTADERTYQLLTQVMGRVGRGHGNSRVIIQTYQPKSPLITAALNRDWDTFYASTLQERKAYRFPPYSYLLKLVCRRKTLAGAQKASRKLVLQLQESIQDQAIEVIGPMPSFHEKRGQYYYWQIVCKSKSRSILQNLVKGLPPNWSADLDPLTLL